MNYEWDVFLSYPRRDPVGPWVKNHFHPLLRKWLGAAMTQEPRVFLDAQMDNGTHWPSNLSQALLKSRCMVAVWAPPYFGSAWCLAEWKSMLARQRKLKLGTGSNPGLIYPIRFFDGASFPSEARRIQSDDYTTFNSFPPGTSAQRLRAYRLFVEKVKGLSEVLAQRIATAPPWNRKWPLIKVPSASKPAPIKFSQVGLG